MPPMYFFDHAVAEKAVKHALVGMDDGDLFLEYNRSESFALDDGQLRQASFNTEMGFGLRAIMGEATALAHGSIINEASLQDAANVVQAVKAGRDGTASVASVAADTTALYPAIDPLASAPVPAKIKLLQDIDAYARDKDSRVKQVMASMSGEYQVVHVYRPDGSHAMDIRPLVRLNVNVVVEENGRTESGSAGLGGRRDYADLLQPETWQAQVDKALAQALLNLTAEEAPAGEFPVVLGPGWPGVLLHEAVGHGLEGDFNRKQTSAFAGLLGERVAAKGITVVDDGTIAGRRGSLSIDDEGVKPENTVLIEDGILKGFIQDRLNARLMGVPLTGNGRRESYAHNPMPRMTNTYMLNGEDKREDMIASVDNGIYAVNFGGGQVDITSGKFVFSASEAWKIENGKLSHPIKGATLIGSGPEVLKHVSMIGDDLALDPGIGTCGKDGQSVPVGVGQPSLKVDQMVVGGTAV